MSSSVGPPPGGDHNRGPELLAIIWVFTGLALLTVSSKIYSRLRIIHQTGLDDILIFFSTLLVLTCTILFTVDVHYGMGRHTYYLTEEQAIKAVKFNYIANPFGIMAYSIPNVAVAIFIDRILPLRPWKRFLLAALVIIQNLAAMVSCVLLFKQCTPTKSLWNFNIKPDHCLRAGMLTDYSYFVGSFSAFTDVVLAIIPVMSFYKLNMRRKAKIATSVLMSMTLAAAVCAIIKTIMLDELKDLSDFTYGTVNLIITAVVEANVIIIAACIPSLRPFVLAVADSVSQSTTMRRLKGSHTSGTSSNWLKLSSLGDHGTEAVSDIDLKADPVSPYDSATGL